MTPDQVTQVIALGNHISMLLEFFIGLMLVLISFIFIREIYKFIVGLLVNHM